MSDLCPHCAQDLRLPPNAYREREKDRAAIREAPDVSCESPEARAWRSKHAVAIARAAAALKDGMSDPLAPLKKRPHGALKNAVMRAVNQLPGVFVFPTGVGSFRVGARFVRMGMKGTPDLVGWKTDQYSRRVGVMYDNAFMIPTFIALEVKVGRDTLRPEQRAFLDKVRDAGGIAAEIRSVEDAVRLLT
jgi:VRR-NUC domain